MQGQKVLLEKTGAQLIEQELRDFQPQTPSRDIQENSLAEPSWERSHEQLSPHHWEKSLLQEPALRLTETGNTLDPLSGLFPSWPLMVLQMQFVLHIHVF